MSVVTAASHCIEYVQKYFRANLIGWVEIQLLAHSVAPFFKETEPHVQIRVSLQREHIEARQSCVEGTEVGVFAANFTPIGMQSVLAGGLPQANARNLQRLAQPAFIEIETV